MAVMDEPHRMPYDVDFSFPLIGNPGLSFKSLFKDINPARMKKMVSREQAL